MALMSNKTKPIPGSMYFEVLVFMVFIIPRRSLHHHAKGRQVGGQVFREFGKDIWFKKPVHDLYI
jgi:hypothetical protein